MGRDEVLKLATDWFKGQGDGGSVSMQAAVWVDKYCLRDIEGNYLEKTPDDMFIRLAKEFGRIEDSYKNPISEQEIYDLFKDFKYVIPGGSMLYGIGNPYSYTTLGSCFVIGDDTDSYGSILKIDEEQIQLMKRRGGVGHDLSHLRPKGSPVSNAAQTSTGAVSFMNRYSNSTREVAQGGRRGALMLTMSVDHPDIVDFIVSKDDTTKLTGCNISVKLTDDFMDDINTDFKPSIEVWNKLVHQAWKSAEPGVLFWDTIINSSPADKYLGFKSISTNPCGEVPLCPYDTCRLMSVNLFSFVLDPFTPDARFDFAKFEDVVIKAQRLMDDVIDLEEEKVNNIMDKVRKGHEGSNYVEFELWRKIKEKLLLGRRTGLSIIGLGDCFAALNLKYGSEKSILFTDSLFKEFHDYAYNSSEVMATERGPFKAWDKSIDPIPRRNIALLTIPPSGSLSILAGISSGIEPVFNLSYTRRRKVEKSDNVVFVDKQGDKWEEYTIVHPGYQKYLDGGGYNVLLPKGTLITKEIIDRYFKNHPYVGSTANEIDPMDRIKLQATAQKYIDHSISSTINLPKETTEQQISDIYMKAWELGCKGVTIYREGCREGVLINKVEKEEFKQHDAPKRPTTLTCDLKKIRIKGVDFWVMVGLFEDKPYELFATDSCLNWKYINPVSGRYEIKRISSGNYSLFQDAEEYGSVTEKLTDEQAAITRLVSTALRHGTDIKFIVEQLEKTQGDLTSFTKAIARVLKLYIANGSHLKGSNCEVCGSELIIQNGCESCTCGYSKCG